MIGRLFGSDMTVQLELWKNELVRRVRDEAPADVLLST
jgi:hypothetical protein